MLKRIMNQETKGLIKVIAITKIREMIKEITEDKIKEMKGDINRDKVSETQTKETERGRFIDKGNHHLTGHRSMIGVEDDLCAIKCFLSRVYRYENE